MGSYCFASPKRRARLRGFTLIELVITIVVLAAGVTGVLSVMSLTTAHSADPMIRTQAHAIAQAHLEEILLREYTDPNASEAGENRATFDDVDDYHALAANGCLAVTPACPVLGDCVCDQFGAPVAALAGYSVGVNVQGATLNGAPAQAVHVSVSHSRFPDLVVTLTGYRASY